LLGASSVMKQTQTQAPVSLAPTNFN
jgi:hypothetical protein